MRLLRTTGLCALLLAGASACADLDVTNPNQPDRERVIATPLDMESVIAGSYLQLYFAYTWRTDLVLSVASFQHSSRAANFGMVQMSKIPREPINNTTADAYVSTYEEMWYGAYSAIVQATDGLVATDPANPDGYEIIDPVTGENRTARARAWARFVQGLGHGLLALTYDQGFIVDVGVDRSALELQSYDAVMAAALVMLDDAVAIAGTENFTIPATWVGDETGPTLSRDQFVRIVNSYQALLRAQVARTPDERAAVNWQAVIADVDAGLPCASAASCQDWEITVNSANWAHGTHIYVVLAAFGSGAWSQTPYFIHGMADQSGGYQAWLNTPVTQRQPFLIQTPDERFPQGTTATQQAQNPGLYIVYGGTRGHGAPDRGTWRWSLYRTTALDDRSDGIAGESPMLSGRDLQLLKAEGLIRTGNAAAAVPIINQSRVANGGLEPVTTSGAPASSCVPKLPNGTCGNLFEALKWEKRMENFAMNYGSWFFDSRGWGDLYLGTPIHWPVPAQELLVLGLPVYTFGGPGGYANGASPGSSYAWPGEN